MEKQIAEERFELAKAALDAVEERFKTGWGFRHPELLEPFRQAVAEAEAAVEAIEAAEREQWAVDNWDLMGFPCKPKP